LPNQTLAIDALQELVRTHPRARVRVTRVLVHEGEAKTVLTTLDAPNANCRGVGPARYPHPDVAPISALTCTSEEIERLD
jgi:hypothetical protein